jgi:isopropylmalate/homocitrate/citramalate synthase
MTKEISIPTKLAFHPRIDLMDETIREGAERASVPPPFAAKCELAEAIAQVGIKSIVVGMFPDVPHNVELLAALLTSQRAGRIPSDVRFLVISHVGITMQQTFAALEGIPGSKASVWVIAITSVSDLQLMHLFPTILRKDRAVVMDQTEWEGLSDLERRERNLTWLDRFLPSVKSAPVGGVMVGLLDAFRADPVHVRDSVALVARHGFTQVRLVDTAGTCTPQQVPALVGKLIGEFPSLEFYGHFHDDFGMATANAILGLSLGMRGVDVAVGGFANRAGHPPLAEVAMALRHLYGIELAGFRHAALYALSRRAERTYGLMENPAQAITGVITHSVQSGIRTQLIERAPRIFDVIDPAEVGAELTKAFGVRSGRDGMLRFLREHASVLAPLGIAATEQNADLFFERLNHEWRRRSERTRELLLEQIDAYQGAIQGSLFTEAAMLEWLKTTGSEGVK